MPVIYLFNYSQYLQQATGAIQLMLVVPFVVALSFAASSVFYFFVEAPIGYVTSGSVELIDRVLVSFARSLSSRLWSSLVR